MSRHPFTAASFYDPEALLRNSPLRPLPQYFCFFSVNNMVNGQVANELSTVLVVCRDGIWETQLWSYVTAGGFLCMTLGGCLLQVPGFLIQVRRAAELFCCWPYLMHHQHVDYKSDAALMQQSSVVVEGSIESLAEPFSLCSQRNAVSCDGCGTCVWSCRSVSPCHSVLCEDRDAIPLRCFQTGNFSQFEFSKSVITIDSRLLQRKIGLWEWLLALRGLKLLLFQCCFCLHEFTQQVIGAHRKYSI